MTKITIFDIAHQAGVSTGTVSRVLNGRADVSVATRDRVLTVVRELKFVPDSGARRLAKGNIELIGVAAFDNNTSRSPYYSILLDAIQEQLLHSGYVARLLSSDVLHCERCAGVIVPGVYLHDRRLERLESDGIPHVVVGWAEKVSWVDLDNQGGVMQGLRHLTRLGHTRIAHLTGARLSQTAQARLETYQQGLQELGLTPEQELIWDGEFTDLGAYRAVRRALERGLDFTAVLCASDEMALGAVAALQDSGIQVPLDVSVIGFDDLADAALARPALTTVRHPIRKMGKIAATLLVETLQGAPVRTEILSTELIVRSSTGPMLNRGPLANRE